MSMSMSLDYMCDIWLFLFHGNQVSEIKRSYMSYINGLKGYLKTLYNNNGCFIFCLLYSVHICEKL